MKKNRLERVNSLLKEIIFEVIQKDVSNPHVNTFISITKVETSPDLHHAKVFVSMICPDAEKPKVVNALQSAAGFIAVHASKKAQLRYFPELIFKLDTALEEHLRIQEILAKIERERLSRPPNLPMTKGILLVNKAKGSTSFHLVALLRRLTKIEKIGHAGTLDPFATGLMVMLIGREFTKRSDEFLGCDKEYQATAHLGIATDSYDIDGEVVSRSDRIPTLAEVELAVATFQGQVSQVPPMFSAKKIQGQKLYDLARKGITVERQPVLVRLETKIIRYNYPELEIHVACSKGTYIRSLAHDLGQLLGTGAHLSSLMRLRSGSFHLEDAVPQEKLQDREFDPTPHLRFP